MRTLATVGHIPLSEYNPEGVEYFAGRLCMTCDRPIMTHELRKDSTLYWCYREQNQFSDGITGCVFDVADVKAPEEPKIKLLGGQSEQN